MRLPFTKIYRTVPEFDRFTDQECEVFLHRAMKEQYVSQLLAALLAVAALFAAFITTLFTLLMLLENLPGTGGRGGVVELVRVYFSIVAALAAGMWCAMKVRNFWVRRAMSRYLGSKKCSGCAYLLLGLAPVEDAITCPECGLVTRLSTLGLTPADLATGN